MSARGRVIEAQPITEKSDTTSSGFDLTSRGQLVRDGLVFQIKLVLDGFRDLILSPMSIIAIILGLLFGGRQPDWFYRKVLAFGRMTEQWIGLFKERDCSAQPKNEGFDAVVDTFEAAIKKDLEEQGFSASANDAMRDTINRFRDDMKRQRRRSSH